MKPVFIFDIDGTLSDPGHRLQHIQQSPPDWDSFFDACAADPPIKHMCRVAAGMIRAGNVLFISGRSDRVRNRTLLWLQDNIAYSISNWALYMRKAGDHRPDHEVKSELMDQVIIDGFRPIMVFDDRNSVVKMWRARGIPCAQVAEGDF